MTFRFATDDEINNWDTYVRKHTYNSNVFQGYEFAQQKQRGGWRARYATNDTVAITILEKHIPTLGNLWYLPKGPGVENTVQLDSVVHDLRPLAAASGVFAVKIEPEIIKTDETMADLLRMGLQSVRPIQPNASTVLIDLSPPLDAIMTGLNQKGRHAIRRAQRDGVSVERVDTSDVNCRRMYDLLAQTAAGSFAIRPYAYYQSFWQRYAAANQGQLFFAFVDDRLVAGAFALLYDNKSTYKDGASVRERTVYGASHLLQWHVIEWAKSRGSIQHDLCGAPPSDQINNTSHPHYGVGRFKTSFNKHITDYVGAFDIVIRPAQYKLWQSYGQRIAQRIHSALHHENFF